jgi:hypothetical protein
MWAFLLSVRCNIAQSLYDVASFCRTYLGPDGLLLDKEAAYRNGAQSCSAISDYCEKKLGVMSLAFAASFCFHLHHSQPQPHPRRASEPDIRSITSFSRAAVGSLDLSICTDIYAWVTCVHSCACARTTHARTSKHMDVLAHALVDSTPEAAR